MRESLILLLFPLSVAASAKSSQTTYVIPYTNAVYICRQNFPKIKDEKLEECVVKVRQGKVKMPKKKKNGPRR